MSEALDETVPTRHVHAIIDPLKRTGGTKVELDGRDLTGSLLGIDISARGGGEPADVVLYLSKKADPVEFEGFSRVYVGEEPDPGPAAAHFLAAIDAELLEKAALNRLDLENEPYGGTAAVLRQLVDWAQGKGSPGGGA